MLEMEMDYHARAYKVNEESEGFKTWFEKVFKVNNIDAGKDFDFNFSEFDDIPVIEIVSFNPFFSIDSLECLYSSYQKDKIVATTPKFVTVN